LEASGYFILPTEILGYFLMWWLIDINSFYNVNVKLSGLSDVLSMCYYQNRSVYDILFFKSSNEYSISRTNLTQTIKTYLIVQFLAKIITNLYFKKLLFTALKIAIIRKSFCVSVVVLLSFQESKNQIVDNNTQTTLTGHDAGSFCCAGNWASPCNARPFAAADWPPNWLLRRQRLRPQLQPKPRTRWRPQRPTTTSCWMGKTQRPLPRCRCCCSETTPTANRRPGRASSFCLFYGTSRAVISNVSDTARRAIPWPWQCSARRSLSLWHPKIVRVSLSSFIRFFFPKVTGTFWFVV